MQLCLVRVNHTSSCFADIAVPLTDLTKKNVPNKVKWLDIHQESFDKLKGEICKQKVRKRGVGVRATSASGEKHTFYTASTFIAPYFHYVIQTRTCILS
jgi:hypothetical protein